MRVITWNINGIRARDAQVNELVAAEAPDILCLQETKALRDQVPDSVKTPDGYDAYWHDAPKGYSGVSLWIRKGSLGTAPVTFSHPTIDFESRVVEATSGDFAIASIYLPNGGKDYEAKLAFLAALRIYVHDARTRAKTLLLCGDMNVARADIDVHPSQRKEGTIGQRKDERDLYEQIIAEGLIDVTRALHPTDDRFFTWWPYWKEARKRNLGWRIDYIFVSDDSALAPRECRVLREFGTSDHAPLVVDFDAT